MFDYTIAYPSIRISTRKKAPTEAFVGKLHPSITVREEDKMDWNINPKVGEIYAVKLPNNYFGAIRILKMENKMYLIATAPFLEKRKPLIDDSRLVEILKQYRYYYEGDPALMWYEGNLPTSLELVGIVPLNKREKKLHCLSSTETHEELGFEAYYEWDYKSQSTLEYNTEVIENSETTEKENKIILLEEDEFWAHINFIKSSGIEEAIRYFSRQSIEEIIQFEATLAYKLYLLDTRKHANSMMDNKNDYFSPDIFLYARCGIIIRGREIYQGVLNNPNTFTSECTCEELLTLSSEAYFLKVGKELNIALDYDYETGSNEDGWSYLG